MTDIIDQAQDIENLARVTAIANARAGIAEGPGLEFCQECEEPIPEARRLAVPGCRLCIDCQRTFEEDGYV